MTADLESLNLDTTARHIDILAIIDTELIKRLYPDPSKQPQSPTAVDYHAVRLFCTGARGGSIVNGTAEPLVTLYPGDTVSLRTVSIYENSNDAVLPYRVTHLLGQQVFNQFTTNFMEIRGVQLNPETRDGLPPRTKLQTFASVGAKVRESGTETLGACFGLYTLERSTQELFGYYWWDWFVMCP